MGTYWRVSNYIDLSGEGGRKSSARWHTAGSRVIYLADSPMSALVESLVHLDVDSEDTPDFYTLLKISAPDGHAVLSLDPPVGTEWKQDLKLTRRIGDAWLASLETAAGACSFRPCAPHLELPAESRASGRETGEVAEVIKERFDNRLFRFGAR